MSRLLSVIGLAAFLSLGVAACHSGGPPGDPGDMGGMDPKMHRVNSSVTRSPEAPTACNAEASKATCSPVESR